MAHYLQVLEHHVIEHVVTVDVGEEEVAQGLFCNFGDGCPELPRRAGVLGVNRYGPVAELDYPYVSACLIVPVGVDAA